MPSLGSGGCNMACVRADRFALAFAFLGCGCEDNGPFGKGFKNPLESCQERANRSNSETITVREKTLLLSSRINKPNEYYLLLKGRILQSPVQNLFLFQPSLGCQRLSHAMIGQKGRLGRQSVAIACAAVRTLRPLQLGPTSPAIGIWEGRTSN